MSGRLLSGAAGDGNQSDAHDNNCNRDSSDTTVAPQPVRHDPPTFHCETRTLSHARTRWRIANGPEQLDANAGGERR
jgi:hypothetical protein